MSFGSRRKVSLDKNSKIYANFYDSKPKLTRKSSKKLAGTSQDDAKKEYIALSKKLVTSYGLKE